MVKNDHNKFIEIVPKVFEFRYGGALLGWSFSLKIEDGRIFISKLWSNHDPVIPSEGEWKEFWKKMDQIDLWNWLEDYSNLNILDGSSWHLKIELDDKKIKSHGSNGYPGNEIGKIVVSEHKSRYFKIFLDAVEKLTGVKIEKTNLFEGFKKIRDPKNAEECKKRGKAYYEKGLYQEAIESYDQALKIDTEDIEALISKGWILGILEKYQEAIECFNKVLEINQGYSKAWVSKGLTLEILDKSQEAIECYDQALKLNPKDEYACFNKGLTLEILDKPQEAIEYFNKVLEINPGNKEARNRRWSVQAKIWDLDIILDETY